MAIIKRERDCPDPPKPPHEPTLHDELVARAARWLLGTGRCRLVLTEKVGPAGERPNATGWCASGKSILIECKTSRADYQADQKKIWRRANITMAEFRYYMTMPGLLEPLDLPSGWGLLEVLPKIVRVSKVAIYMPMSLYARNAERMMLISEARPDTPYQAQWRAADG